MCSFPVAVAAVVISFVAWTGGTFDSFGESFRRATFQVVSSMTTTGFATNGSGDFYAPPRTYGARLSIDF